MLGNASLFMDMVGHVVVAWMWLRQAAAAVARRNDCQAPMCAFYDGKIHAASYIFWRELPQVTYKVALLSALDDSCVRVRDDWF